MPTTPVRILSKPGTKRDGTLFDGDHYVDTQWCRFQRGLPRKIGGCVSVSQNLPQRVYGTYSFSANAAQYIHLGSESQLNQRVINNMGGIVSSADRTPAGLVASVDNIWGMDAIFDIPTLNGMALVAMAAPNMDIDSTALRNIYYGLITGNTVLVASGQDPVSGGVITVGNYLVGYGSDGIVQWSAANDLAAGTLDSANVTQQKIVAAGRIRGGGVPAALLWSLDSLILMTFNDPAGTLWDFDTLADELSILSSRCVVDYDGTKYWPGVDRFLAYNGIVREVPNELNVNYFFDNLNFLQRQKVFGIKVPRFGEIWWCYPRGNATECTHALILNVREGSWYDTELLGEGRTDGIFAKVYNKPFMLGAEQTVDGFDLWQHETGVNQVRLADIQPIPSHFETAEISMLTAEEAKSQTLRVAEIEPDFVQAGELTLTVRGRANARSAVISGDPKTITEQPTPPAGVDADEQLVRVKDAKRLMSFRIDSNAEDGDYQMGQMFAHVEPDDGRITQ